MFDLNDFFYEDGIDDVLAAYVNNLLTATIRAEYRNTETITATRQLLDADTPIQILTPSGSDQDVELAVEATTNHLMVIYNPSGNSYDLVIKDDSGSITYATLDAGEYCICYPMSSVWLVSNPFEYIAYVDGVVDTLISGLKLQWDSTTSITVLTGQCYAENGNKIDVTSAITKSSLSLSSGTWYHIYLYLDSGSPAAEVVTTAPTAWKGTAYSKTGDTSRRYVGSIRTDGSGNVLQFTMIGDTIMYGENETTTLRVQSGFSATTETDISLSSLIPVTSQLAFVTIVNASGSGQIFYSGASGNDNVAPPTTGILTISASVTKQTWHPTDSSQNISGALNAGSGSVNINCSGYKFYR